MEKTTAQDTKKEKGLIKKVLNSILGGTIVGGTLGAIEGLTESNIFNSPQAYSAIIGADVAIEVMDKETSIPSLLINPTTLGASYAISYNVTRSLVQYLKQ